jgi:hypothetical protein
MFKSMISIRRRKVLLVAFASIPGVASAASPRIVNIRFGIVREVSDGVMEFVVETARIPRKLKDTGFRFGIGFENPDCVPIEWYEQVHLPSELKEVSGNMQRARNKVMRTRTFKSDQPTVVDDFWFDEGDPLGPHRMELYVNGVMRYAIDFTVVDK